MESCSRIAQVQGWFQSYRPGGFTHGDAIIEAIRKRGVDLVSPTKDPPGGPGMVIFDRVDAALCDRLQKASRQGFDRVLAVGTAAKTLSEGSVWRLLQAGAADVFAWDSMPDAAATVAARFERYAMVDQLVQSPELQSELAGGSLAWLAVLRQVVEVAAFSDSSVLITGESGTGKELIARLVHRLDRRPNKGPFVVLDCTTVSPELSGSEFFGHERGAFTSAISSRDGAFALADSGTLFLDEVGELPLALQAELLRVIQERVYKRVGSNTWRQVNFRLVCATNRNLIEEEARGAFRRDFYYRIANWTFALPPLRARRQDILPLSRHFLQQMSGHTPPPEPDAAVRDYLLTRDYPGNIRELRHLVTRMLSRHVGDGPLTVGDVPPEERIADTDGLRRPWQDSHFQDGIRRALAMGVGLRGINNLTAELAIQTALDDENGNLQRAAKRLQVTDRALQLRRAARRQQAEKDQIACFEQPDAIPDTNSSEIATAMAAP